MIDEHLSRRLEQTTAEAERILGVSIESATPAGTDRLARLITVLDERLAPDGRSAVEDHRAALERLHHRFQARFRALADVQTGLAELREITAPSAMLARTPGALCQGSKFSRAIVSLLGSGRIRPSSSSCEATPSGSSTR